MMKVVSFATNHLHDKKGVIWMFSYLKKTMKRKKIYWDWSGLDIVVDGIIDVGARTGTDFLIVNFPTIKHFLIECDTDVLEELEKLYKDLNIEYELFANMLSKRSGEEREFLISGSKSSYLYSLAYYEKNRTYKDVRTLVSKTLDECLLSNLDANGQYLIKLDTEGSELDILTGGLGVLSKCTAVVIEAPNQLRFEGGYKMLDLCTFMADHDFILKEIFTAQTVIRSRNQEKKKYVSYCDMMFIKRGTAVY